MLDNKEISCLELTMTYIYETATRGLALGAVADVNFEWAKNEAIACDKELAQGKLRGPLHGIPISVKDMIHLEGTVATNGLISHAANIASKDGIIAAVLKKNGAIPFVKSNVPQLLMIPETDNHIFGLSMNPIDIGRASGGSSGGEAALIGSRCSPVGIGTDIGGSIRIPAAFCGIYGFKPSVARTTVKGSQANGHEYDNEPFIGVSAATGPMGRCVDDLITIQKCLVSDYIFENDFTVPPLPFDEKITEEFANPKRKLKIGYVKDDGTFYPTPPAFAAMDKAIEVLKGAGHELIELDNSYFEVSQLIPFRLVVS